MRPYQVQLILVKIVLHTDPWLSRQSEILCTGWTSENKRKLFGGWTEMCRCFQMIYVDAHRDTDSVRHSLESVTGAADIRLRSRSANWSLEDNTACYGRDKLWVNMADCVPLSPPICLSHTYKSFDSKKNKESNISITRCCGLITLCYITVDLGVMAMKWYSTLPDFHNWCLTIRCSLVLLAVFLQVRLPLNQNQHP